MAQEIPQTQGDMMKLMGMTKEMYQICGEKLLNVTSKYAQKRRRDTEYEARDQIRSKTKSNPHPKTEEPKKPLPLQSTSKPGRHQREKIIF
jgi:hypothetical protein